MLLLIVLIPVSQLYFINVIHICEMNRSCINTFSYLRSLFIMVLCVTRLLFCAQHSFAKGLTGDKATNQIQADTTRFNITGRVIDETGAPLPGATAFISNSKWAVGTDNKGVFTLSGLPVGNYELLVRMVGYVTFTQNFTINHSSIGINVSLKPDAIGLNEVKISAKPDPNRARYLKIFTEAFIGRSSVAKNAKIVNTDVIRFKYIKAAGTLTAHSTDFIKIENTALGYYVYYLLNAFAFNQQNQTFAYNGKIYFEELKGDEKKEVLWSRNRSSVYEGSMQHFFSALYTGTTVSEGFKVYKIADSELGQTPNFNISGSTRSRSITISRINIDLANRKPVKPDSMFKTVNANKVLQLPLLVKDGDTTRFYICYTRKGEPSGFLNSGAHLDIPVPNAQISRLYQLDNNVVLNKNGTLTPEQSTMIEGFWGWRRIGDALPEEIAQQLNIEAQRMTTAPPAESAPVEKIHIQMDRPWYLTGDTAWMKVYVVDAYNKPAGDSKVCFVELVDKNKRVIKNLRLPLNAGIAWGEIALSDSLIKRGTYLLRVYTNSTQKNGNSFFYKAIRLADLSSASAKVKNIAPTQNQSPISDSLKLQFFPEGGKMITDVISRIAVKATALGNPVNNASGYIENEEKSHIAKFETNESGVSAFYLKPLTQGKYWAVLTLPNRQEKRFALPQPQSAGVNMVIKQNDEDITVYLNAANLNGQTPLNLVIKSDDRVAYKTEKLLAATADSIVISKTELPEGILQFNLYTGSNSVAERMVYNKSNKQLNIKLTPGKAAYKPYDKVELNIAVTDADNGPVSGSFSVSVNNEADVAGSDNNLKNILSDLLLGDKVKDSKSVLTRDLAKPNADTQHQLDDLLLTINAQNGKEQALTQPSANLPQDTSSALRGQVLTAKGKPSAASTVGLFFPLGGPVLTTVSDVNARFVFDNIPVKRGEPYYIVAKDKNKDLIVKVDKYEPPGITDQKMADTLVTADIDFITKRIGELTTGNILGTELKEVLIKDKKKAEPTIKELVTQRSSNMGGRPDQVLSFIDLLGCNTGSLGECLALKLPGVILSADTMGNISLIARGRGNGAMSVFVDGIERREALRNLTTRGVASVEILKGGNASAYGIRGGNGVVVITTKGGELDYATYEQEYYAPGSTKTSPVKRYIFENGFDMAKGFYTPDYNAIPGSLIDKWRPTIYWNPNVITGTDGKAQLSYFTNSAPGTYRVTIEGIDDYGRIARQVFRYTVAN